MGCPEILFILRQRARQFSERELWIQGMRWNSQEKLGESWIQEKASQLPKFDELPKPRPLPERHWFCARIHLISHESHTDSNSHGTKARSLLGCLRPRSRIWMLSSRVLSCPRVRRSEHAMVILPTSMKGRMSLLSSRMTPLTLGWKIRASNKFNVSSSLK